MSRRLPPAEEILTDRQHPHLVDALPLGSHVVIHPPLSPNHTYRAVIIGYHHPDLYGRSSGVRYIVDYLDPVHINDDLMSRVYYDKFVEADQYVIEELPL